MRARPAGVDRRLSSAGSARRPLASHASNSKVADSAARHRSNSTSHRARPTPGTGRGVEGSALTRQRVIAAVGCQKSAASAWRRQRRSAMPIPPGRLWRRAAAARETIIERRPTSAITAPSLRLSFFETSEHRLLVSRFDVDHPVGASPGRSDCRREQILAGHPETGRPV